MKIYDLDTELWREYDFEGRIYRIELPIKLYLTDNGTTHRVVDSHGVVHCVPTVGFKGCVLRWAPKDKNKPVSF